MTGQRIDFKALVADRTVFVFGDTVRAFDAGTLLAVMRAEHAQRQRVWLEALVSSYLSATRDDLWWVSGADGWDYLLTAEPNAELRASALGVTHWQFGKGPAVVVGWELVPSAGPSAQAADAAPHDWGDNQLCLACGQHNDGRVRSLVCPGKPAEDADIEPPAVEEK
jgi:hypothetical protein